MRHSRTGATLRAGACALFLALAAAGCSSTGGGGGGGGSPNMITREQFGDLPEGTAFTIVQRFRSRWLRPRTQGGFNDPTPYYAEVFVDDLRFGPIESLQRISSTQIDRIEYISATDATTLYGTGFAGGIIKIHTIGR
ncbi:MAG TPA: hypothetical protein VLA09_11855 [Longimicrobiales bacterium]|nr:hypothetical protein [Longimicrobiales bacterium]